MICSLTYNSILDATPRCAVILDTRCRTTITTDACCVRKRRGTKEASERAFMRQKATASFGRLPVFFRSSSINRSIDLSSRARTMLSRVLGGVARRTAGSCLHRSLSRPLVRPSTVRLVATSFSSSSSSAAAAAAAAQQARGAAWSRLRWPLGFALGAAALTVRRALFRGSALRCLCHCMLIGDCPARLSRLLAKQARHLRQPPPLLLLLCTSTRQLPAHRMAKPMTPRSLHRHQQHQRQPRLMRPRSARSHRPRSSTSCSSAAEQRPSLRSTSSARSLATPRSVLALSHRQPHHHYHHHYHHRTTTLVGRHLVGLVSLRLPHARSLLGNGLYHHHHHHHLSMHYIDILIPIPIPNVTHVDLVGGVGGRAAIHALAAQQGALGRGQRARQAQLPRHRRTTRDVRLHATQRGAIAALLFLC